jgi:hypothetical protein
MKVEDDEFGGGFAEVRDGEPVVPVIRDHQEPGSEDA